MAKKGKILFSSLMAIAMSASLGIGATFALFTSESTVDVSVTSGMVSVYATVDTNSIKTYSGQDHSVPVSVYDSSKANGGLKFSEGGTVVWSDTTNTIAVNAMIPGDRVSFAIKVENRSNVNVQYQTVISCLEGTTLFNALSVTIGTNTFTGSTAVSNWETIRHDDTIQEFSIPVEISFPWSDSYPPELQGQSTKITYAVHVVQGNANVTNPTP